MQSEKVRDLTELERSTLARRLAEFQRVQKAAAALAREMKQAADAYEDCLALVTGGDKSLGVNHESGTLVRKPKG